MTEIKLRILNFNPNYSKLLSLPIVAIVFFGTSSYGQIPLLSKNLYETVCQQFSSYQSTGAIQPPIKNDPDKEAGCQGWMRWDKNPLSGSQFTKKTCAEIDESDDDGDDFGPNAPFYCWKCGASGSETSRHPCVDEPDKGGATKQKCRTRVCRTLSSVMENGVRVFSRYCENPAPPSTWINKCVNSTSTDGRLVYRCFCNTPLCNQCQDTEERWTAANCPIATVPPQTSPKPTDRPIPVHGKMHWISDDKK